MICIVYTFCDTLITPTNSINIMRNYVSRNFFTSLCNTYLVARVLAGVNFLFCGTDWLLLLYLTLLGHKLVHGSVVCSSTTSPGAKALENIL